MISDTLTPLAQVASWIGIDLWKLAGIDRTNSPNKTNKCLCYSQSPENSNSFNRDDLIKLLKYSEDYFFQESNTYVAPFLIEDERHKFDNFLTKNRLQYTTVIPNYPCGDLVYGKKRLEDLGNFILDKTDLENVFFTFNTSSTVNKEDIRILYTEDDLERDIELHYNYHGYEIRPYKKIIETSIDENTKEFKVIIPAYLLVKPELFESDFCLANVSTNYVDEVNVQIEVFDICNQAHFVVNDENCEEKLYSACFSVKTVHKRKYIQLNPIQCNEDGTYTRYCMSNIPVEKSINYITGQSLNYKREINSTINSIISKIMIHFIDCFDSNSCNCDNCANKRIDYYKEVQKTLTRIDVDEVEKNYAILVDKIGLSLAGGLKPTVGLIQANKDIQNIKCNDKGFGAKYI